MIVTPELLPMKLKFSEVNVPNTSGPSEGAVLRAMIVFLEVSVPLLLLMPPPRNWAVLPEMVLLVTLTCAAAIVHAATAADAKRRLAGRVT